MPAGGECSRESRRQARQKAPTDKRRVWPCRPWCGGGRTQWTCYSSAVRRAGPAASYKPSLSSRRINATGPLADTHRDRHTDRQTDCWEASGQEKEEESGQ